jgi:hypothetical protein
MGRKRDLEARLSFLGFTEADRELLAGLRPAFERRAELLVAAFHSTDTCSRFRRPERFSPIRT